MRPFRLGTFRRGRLGVWSMSGEFLNFLYALVGFFLALMAVRWWFYVLEVRKVKRETAKIRRETDRRIADMRREAEKFRREADEYRREEDR